MRVAFHVLPAQVTDEATKERIAAAREGLEAAGFRAFATEQIRNLRAYMSDGPEHTAAALLD